MSSSASANDITAMSFRFAVQWSIPLYELKSYSDEIIKCTLKSNRYRLKNLESLDFTFVLDCGDDYTMEVKNWNSSPLFLEDVLVLIKDRVYRVKCNPNNTLKRLIFNQDVLAQNKFKDDNLTFHCIMVIPTKVKPVVSDYPPFRTTYKKNDEGIIEFESCLLTNHYNLSPDGFAPGGYDAVNDFRYSSRIPDFNVKKALNMIGEAHERHNPILKALCSEYLMENLTAENVAAVLKQSLRYDAKDLTQKCADFLAEQCKIISN